MLKRLFKKNLLQKQYQNLIYDINELERELQELTDSDLKLKSLELQSQYKFNQDLKELIVKAFALTREASVRTLGLRHFDVQLLGGLVLNNQKIAEMKTGEGKTLVSTLPAFLNAITKKGVHIVTVNDYLANRDQVSMGQIYRFLGLDTGLIQSSMSILEKQENYKADITYVTNSELAFDYLRDNMVFTVKDMVLRPLNYCILDEVDSILIDEAQTPLIISNPLPTKVQKYIIASEVTEYLQLNQDYKVDEKNKNVVLTEAGTQRIEEILNIQNLYDIKDPWIPYILNALRANALYFRNVDYLVQNNRVIIVDEFTGRLMPDRRWSEGLHQAIEAKERLPIRNKAETVAQITYQNFFLLYPKLAGMTGTGKTSEIEFEKIYKLSVEEIPTAKPNQRKDLPDLIYKDQFSKWKAIAETCYQLSSMGQPILIGTKTIETSEMLAQLLSDYNLSYQLLNAKPENVKQESAIVAQAGKQKSITIATNMAGRGTDIILGGNINFQSQKKVYDLLTLAKESPTLNLMFQSSWINQSKGISQRVISILFSLINDSKFLELSDLDIFRMVLENDRISTPWISYQYSIRYLIRELGSFYQKNQTQENKIVKNLGGLYILGTERNDSRRVDNQLRGRCGRQGDPGTSRFFVSLEDNLLRLFGSSKLRKFLQTQMLDDSPLESNLVTQSLNSAQTKIEERAYQGRKNLFDYDDILNQQRTIVYSERKKILEKASLSKLIFAYGEQVILELLQDLVNQDLSGNSSEMNYSLSFLEDLLGKKLLFQFFQNNPGSLSIFDFQELELYLVNEFWLTYSAKQAELAIYGDELLKTLEQNILLRNLDKTWREHLQTMSLMREAVGWRGYGQQNPLYEYKKEAFWLFQMQKKVFRHLVIYELLRISIL